MAAEELPDLDELMIELVRLERREAELTKLLERVSERAAFFPNAFGAREVGRVTLERQALLDRIDEVKALLLPLRRVPD
jgi:hypothetical protein